MKKHLLALLCITSALNSVPAQNIDGYKYVNVRTLVYNSGARDIYQISARLRNNFLTKGFIVLSNESSDWPTEAKTDPCLILVCAQFTNGSSTVGFSLKNCRNEIVFEEKSTSANWGDMQDNYNRALKNCWNRFDKLPYSFNPTKTPELDYPQVEKTNETEESIKSYLSMNKIDPIEGVYKSYQSDQLFYYKIGIIKRKDKFQAIVLETDLKQWKQGEVKAVFEQSSVKGLYSVKWLMSNKTTYETFGKLDNDALLSIEFRDPKSGEKRFDSFVKMFPSNSNDGTTNGSSSRVSGSGFILAPSGIIATNAHVIDRASRIEVTISNEIQRIVYKAKVVLSDVKNDVAILQIDDEKFKPFTTIPYGIAERSEIGESVFTIGYPLNDVMGNNYKVADGIISAKSGIDDDLRYYQISVPLQPGNSGGPLFNKDGNVIGVTSSRLNGYAIGTTVQNVNYAIKVSYLLNLYNMLPNATQLPATSTLVGKSLQDQVKSLKDYVCLINVF